MFIEVVVAVTTMIPPTKGTSPKNSNQSKLLKMWRLQQQKIIKFKNKILRSRTSLIGTH